MDRPKTQSTTTTRGARREKRRIGKEAVGRSRKERRLLCIRRRYHNRVMGCHNGYQTDEGNGH